MDRARDGGEGDGREDGRGDREGRSGVGASSEPAARGARVEDATLELSGVGPPTGSVWLRVDTPGVLDCS